MTRNAAHMPVVGAAAPAQDPDVRKAREKLRAESAKLNRIAVVEDFGFVQFGMALARRI